MVNDYEQPSQTDSIPLNTTPSVSEPSDVTGETDRDPPVMESDLEIITPHHPDLDILKVSISATPGQWVF